MADDHTDEALLRRLYEAHQGSIAAVHEAGDFEVGYFTVRDWLIRHGIHEPATYDVSDEDGQDDAPSEPDDAQAVQDAEPAEGAPGPSESTPRWNAEYRNHRRRRRRSNLESIDVHVPDGVTADALRAAVDDGAETIDDVCEAIGVEPGRRHHGVGAIRAALHRLGLYEELDDPERRHDREVVT